jgi:hypothetical protein
MIPVSPGREAWFIISSTVQYAAGLAVLGCMYWADWLGGIAGIESLKLIAPLIIAATAHSILIVEGVPMVAERYLRRRQRVGREEGRRETQQLWEEWNRRRLEAHKEGKEFNEPPPKGD